eukprot:14258593-Alexandrium_andersonii.AAC.1
MDRLLAWEHQKACDARLFERSAQAIGLLDERRGFLMSGKTSGKVKRQREQWAHDEAGVLHDAWSGPCKLTG